MRWISNQNFQKNLLFSELKFTCSRTKFKRERVQIFLRIFFYFYTVCIRDLNIELCKKRKINIFRSLLTTFNGSNTIWVVQPLPKINLSLKSNHQISLSKSLIHTVSPKKYLISVLNGIFKELKLVRSTNVSSLKMHCNVETACIKRM